MTEKILFVDDEPDMLSTLSRIFLRNSGLVVRTAKTADRALSILREGETAVIISDLRMPGMNGIDLLKQVKMEFPQTVRILLTGYAETETVIQALNEEIVYRFITKPFSRNALRLNVYDALSMYRLNRESAHILKGGITETRMKYEYTASEYRTLLKIANHLSEEKDYAVLLRRLLYLSRKITGADAGNIYLRRKDNNGKENLRLEYSHTFSKNIPFERKTIPLSKASITGYTAITGEMLSIPYVYDLPADVPFQFNSSSDRLYGYRTQSLLAVPLKDSDRNLIGVLELVNCSGKQTGRSTPFLKRTKPMAAAIAAIAASVLAGLETKHQLLEWFEHFIKAVVSVKESGKKVNVGHSRRVAAYALSLAKAVNTDTGDFADIRFSSNELKEIEYAALLHEFNLKKSDDHKLRDIENKANNTYNFLKKIPWPAQYGNIPKYVMLHHRTNHQGELPLQSKILSIADVYDTFILDGKKNQPGGIDERLWSLFKNNCIAKKRYLPGYRAIRSRRAYETVH